MRLLGRMTAAEKALAERDPQPVRLRHFVTVDDGLTYVENTPEIDRAGKFIFDHAKALIGIHGELPAELPRLTQADLERFEREGFTILVISYGAMTF